jgi:dTDP-glucose pyrophosphorylase
MLKEITKAVIPVAGLGTRMLPATNKIIKINKDSHSKIFNIQIIN